MQVDILGPVRVRVGDREIDPGGPRSRALLARLALDAGQPVRAATLIEDLWGMDEPADALNALQSIVSRARRRLPPGTLVSTPAGYVLDAAVDAHEFERLAATGHTGQALALWRGEAFADLSAVPFVDSALVRLNELRLGVLEAHLASMVNDGADPAVVTELAELTAAHPYREGLWLLYLRALVATGRSAEALTSYEELRSRLAEDLGADPSADLQELHLSILRGEKMSSGRTTVRLPVGLTTFVGREDALTELGEALGSHRLVTVIGPGGAGKTRLSIEAARMVADRFDDVWLVELAQVTAGDDILATILSTMGLLEVTVIDRRASGPRADERTRLLEALGPARGLLVLDNCEHLIDDVARIVEDALAHAPRLVVLTTSREPLRLLGEYAYSLDPLTIPPPAIELERAMEYSAIELFVQRAQAVDRSFVIDAATFGPTREICVRLDGQPLALELAAARLRSLTVAQVAERLSDRFRLLTGGSRTSLPRHRTLRAVVEWSWDLLEPEERDLAERLAVFPGGVTSQSAAAVFGRSDVVDLLESLADKSLLVPVRGEVPRFRMLETLREYGVERLIERGVVQDVRRAHLDYFLEFVEHRESELRGPQQLQAFAAFDAERGNISAALRFAVDQKDRGRSARILANMGWYWATRSQESEVMTWVHTIEDLPGEADVSTELALQVLSIVAAMAEQDKDRVAPHVQRILELFDTGEARGPFVDIAMAGIEFFGALGDRTVPEPSDTWTKATITLMRVLLLDNAGELQGGVQPLNEAIAGFNEVGDRWGIAMALSQRGVLESYTGDVKAALRSWEEALPLLAALGAEEDYEFARMRLLGLRMSTAGEEDFGQLRADLELRLRDARASGMERPVFLARLYMGQFERIVGNPRRAIEILESALSSARSRDDSFTGSPQMLSWVYALLAAAWADTGELVSAERMLQASVETVMRIDDMPILSTIAVVAAQLVHAQGEAELAARRLGAADRIRGQADLSNRDARVLSERLRGELGEENFTSLFAEGRGLDREEAIALAFGIQPGTEG